MQEREEELALARPTIEVTPPADALVAADPAAALRRRVEARAARGRVSGSLRALRLRAAGGRAG